ncbi:MAG: virulence factor family protein [Bacteroidota bacterium]
MTVTRALSLALLSLALLSSALAIGCEPTESTVDGGVLGRVLVFEPDDQPTGLVFLLSDGRGWSGDMTRAAKHLRKRGLIVAGVDTAAVLTNLARDRKDCHDLTGAFERTSEAIQKSADLQFYFLPVLAGIKEGGILALAGLWQAGPETIGGVATVDFDPKLPGIVPLCADPRAERTPEVESFSYSPPQRMFGWWQAAWTDPPSQAARQFASAAGAVFPPAETGARSKTPSRLLTAMLDWGSEERSRDAEGALELGGLPVVDLPGRPGATNIAIILSGDGGWRDLDRSVGEILANAGIHVVGIDCLRYFWSAKSAETITSDLEHLIEDLAHRTPKARIALVGYSFGADILPAVFNRLGPATRDRVALLSLLALGRDAHFEIHVEGWLGGDPQEDAAPIAPEIARIDPRLIQCIYGEDEADESGCLDPHLKSAQVVGIPGGHHFDEDYETLAQRILARMRAAS